MTEASEGMAILVTVPSLLSSPVASTNVGGAIDAPQ